MIVGRTLGRARPGIPSKPPRMIVSVVAGAILGAIFLFGTGLLLPQIFTGDHRVLARIAAVWPIFALMQPLNGWLRPRRHPDRRRRL